MKQQRQDNQIQSYIENCVEDRLQPEFMGKNLRQDCVDFYLWSFHSLFCLCLSCVCVCVFSFLLPIFSNIHVFGVRINSAPQIRSYWKLLRCWQMLQRYIFYNARYHHYLHFSHVNYLCLFLCSFLLSSHTCSSRKFSAASNINFGHWNLEDYYY